MLQVEGTEQRGKWDVKNREKYKSHGKVNSCGIVDGREEERVETRKIAGKGSEGNGR